MKLVSFPEQTVVIAKDQPEYFPVPAHRFNDEEGRIAFCWSLSWRERLGVLFAGTIWHQVLTFNRPLQPQKLTVEKPEMESIVITTECRFDAAPAIDGAELARSNAKIEAYVSERLK